MNLIFIISPTLMTDDFGFELCQNIGNVYKEIQTQQREKKKFSLII